jgi:hypothetical protein
VAKSFESLGVACAMLLEREVEQVGEKVHGEKVSLSLLGGRGLVQLSFIKGPATENTKKVTVERLNGFVRKLEKQVQSDQVKGMGSYIEVAGVG